jgi:hypothetical protein
LHVRLPVVGITGSLTPVEQDRMRVPEILFQGEYWDRKGRTEGENEESYIMKSLIICSLLQIIERSFQERGRIDGTWNTNGRNEKCLQKFRSTNLDQRDHFGDLGIHSRIILIRS